MQQIFRYPVLSGFGHVLKIANWYIPDSNKSLKNTGVYCHCQLYDRWRGSTSRLVCGGREKALPCRTTRHQGICSSSQ